jgi:pyruvate/2-oxoacid:ferredoxin oxidoreductase beta subunit
MSLKGDWMRYFFGFAVILFLSGCATWQGVKSDSKDAAEWTKEKVNKGATYVKEKTE